MWPQCTFAFQSSAAMQSAMASETTAEVLADVANYTSITPPNALASRRISVLSPIGRLRRRAPYR